YFEHVGTRNFRWRKGGPQAIGAFGKALANGRGDLNVRQVLGFLEPNDSWIERGELVDPVAAKESFRGGVPGLPWVQRHRRKGQGGLDILRKRSAHFDDQTLARMRLVAASDARKEGQQREKARRREDE